MTESNLDNILMAQKDDLYDQLGTVTTYEDMREVLRPDGFETVSMRVIMTVLARLKFVQRLWNEASYGYKGQEICRRIEVMLRNTRDDLHHAATAKNRELTVAICECSSIADHFRCLCGTPA